MPLGAAWAGNPASSHPNDHVFDSDPNVRNTETSSFDVLKVESPACNFTMSAIPRNNMFETVQNRAGSIRVSLGRKFGLVYLKLTIGYVRRGQNVCQHRLWAIPSVSNNGLFCSRQNHRASSVLANPKQPIVSSIVWM